MKTNTPNPLIPQGALPDAQGKSHVRIAVFTILAVHMVLLGALLMAGCRKSSDVAGLDTNPVAPVFDTNPVSSFTQTPTSTPPVVPINPVPFVQPESNLTSIVPDKVLQTEGERQHIVVAGDSFYKLAKQYGVSMQAIKLANPGVDSTKLKVGQPLKIPPPSAIAAKATLATATETTEKIHVVKSGETLTSIATAEKTTVKALRAANSLKTTQIKVGQKLKVPVKTATPPPEPFAAPSATANTTAPAGTVIP